MNELFKLRDLLQGVIDNPYTSTQLFSKARAELARVKQQLKRWEERDVVIKFEDKDA